MKTGGPISIDELHSVAAELFAKNGYPSTSVRAIAERLGVKAGSLYYHIDSKDDLLFNLVDGALDRLTRAVASVVESDSEPIDKLSAALRAHLFDGLAFTNEMIVTVRESANLAPDRVDLVRQKRRHYEGLFQMLLEQGIEAGRLRCTDVRMTSYAALGMCNWICQIYRPSGRLTAEQISDLCVGMIMSGLAKGQDVGCRPEE